MIEKFRYEYLRREGLDMRKAAPDKYFREINEIIIQMRYNLDD